MFRGRRHWCFYLKLGIAFSNNQCSINENVSYYALVKFCTSNQL